MTRRTQTIPVPDIAFGSYKITDELTGGRSCEVIREALDTGYRYIDTAAFYQNEDVIGQAIEDSGISRGELLLQTKVWKTELSYEKTRRSIEASLGKLRTDYLDYLLIHWPKESPDDPDWKIKLRESWHAMEDAKEEGIVREIGLSNCLPHHIMALQDTMRIPPVLDQLELHVGHMQYAAVVWLQKHGIRVQAWSPLGRTRIFEHPSLIEMASRYGVTLSDLVLRFLLQQGISVVPKATSIPHMEANLHPAEFTISNEDMSFLLCMPSVGWAGEHPDFEREAVDNRYLLKR